MLTDNQVIYNGEAIYENHGVIAGTPTSPFLADVYLKEVDRYFSDTNVIYTRYSDDISCLLQIRRRLRPIKGKSKNSSNSID